MRGGGSGLSDEGVVISRREDPRDEGWGRRLLPVATRGRSGSSRVFTGDLLRVANNLRGSIPQSTVGGTHPVPLRSRWSMERGR